jgi:hypothetical protein
MALLLSDGQVVFVLEPDGFIEHPRKRSAEKGVKAARVSPRSVMMEKSKNVFTTSTTAMNAHR